MNITLDEIRSNAPDGATHYYICGGHAWYFKGDRNLKVYHRHEWLPYSKTGFGFNLSQIKPLN